MSMIYTSDVICPDCKSRLSDNDKVADCLSSDKFEFCGVDEAETGFIYVCECGKEFIVPFRESE